MNPDELLHRPITELASLIEGGDAKPSETLEAHIARIERLDATINAFTRTTFDLAREQAERLDAELTQGNYRGPLHGIPVALKDLFDLEGHPTTAGSRILGKSAAGETAECVQRLIESGAVIIGKTNLQEFARGGTGANSAFGPARNPWSLEHTPGGSSSGSAACVAAGMAAAALGSDTGGSVRLPASFCNLVGIRSTYGRVSRAGAVPLGLSFDNVGPLARTVEDAALILQAIAGPDPKDPTTGTNPEPDFLESLNEGVRGVTLGVPTNHFWPGEDTEAETIVREAIARFEMLGAKLVEVEIPWARLGQVAYAADRGARGCGIPPEIPRKPPRRLRLARSRFLRVQPLHPGLALRAGAKGPNILHPSGGGGFPQGGRRAHTHRRRRAPNHRGLPRRHEDVADSER